MPGCCSEDYSERSRRNHDHCLQERICGLSGTEWVTVFPIEDISGYRYSSVAGNGYGCDLTESYFEEAEWYLRFVLRGEDRLSINLDSCNQKRCISLSSAMEEMQLGESVAPDMEEMIVQQMMTESMMDILTDQEGTYLCPLF